MAVQTRNVDTENSMAVTPNEHHANDRVVSCRRNRLVCQETMFDDGIFVDCEIDLVSELQRMRLQG
jgi:hypothetical protein